MKIGEKILLDFFFIQTYFYGVIELGNESGEWSEWHQQWLLHNQCG